MSAPARWFNSLIGAAFALLLAAIAVYIAVDLLRPVLPWLIVIGSMAALITLWRSWARSRW